MEYPGDKGRGAGAGPVCPYTKAVDLIELFFLALLVAGAWFWLDTLKAREAGVAAARDACEADGLLFLDDTVAGRHSRLVRDDDGRLRWQRTFVFEYSDTGDNRRSGSVTLLGHEVELLQLEPAPRSHLQLVRNSDETLH